MRHPFPISVLHLIFGALLIWTLGTVLALASGKRLGHKFFSGLLFADSLVLMAGAISGFTGNVQWQAPWPINFGVAPWLNRLDALSAIFIGILGIVSAAVAMFSPGYLSHMGDRISPGSYWACFFLFLISMAEVVLSGNVLTFLVFWELMSLSSVALVATDHGNRRVQR